ncbi:MAG: hypothetical protein IPP12_04470 [Nitrospira sp.]|nr:hypothetical protein [Nitrospira sp.]
MRQINSDEIEVVSGGSLLAVPLTVIGMIGAVAAFGYMVGKDMAERDNGITCRNKV